MKPGTRVRRRSDPDDTGIVEPPNEWSHAGEVPVRWDIGDYVTNISPDKLELCPHDASWDESVP